MKSIKKFDTFTTLNKDPKDTKIEKLKDELQTEKIMESSTTNHSVIIRYKDFIS